MSRLAFFGTPTTAAVVLRALHDAGHEVVLVITAADRRRGRGSAPGPTPVKQLAAELGLPVSHDPGDVLACGAELGVVVAYGRLLEPALLEHLAMVNLHFSLLPRWRGAAPVERAILAGDETTGVCLMAIDEGLDTGAVYGCAETAIRPGETAEHLRSRLAELGSALLVERLEGGPATLGVPVVQHGESSYAAKIDPAELRIDWRRPAAEIERLVRVGRAWTTFHSRRLIVETARVAGAGWAEAAGVMPGEPAVGGRGAAPQGPPAAPVPGTLFGGLVSTGDGFLELVRVRAEGRASQTFDAWARGARLAEAERLGP